MAWAHTHTHTSKHMHNHTSQGASQRVYKRNRHKRRCEVYSKAMFFAVLSPT